MSASQDIVMVYVQYKLWVQSTHILIFMRHLRPVQIVKNHVQKRH